MKFSLSFCVVLVSALCLSLLGCSKKQQEKGTVLATVGSRTITLDQFEEKFKEMPPTLKPKEEGLEGLRSFLETMIQKELVAQAAEEEFAELSDRQKTRLENRTRNIVFEVLEGREVRPDFVVTEAEVEELHEKRRIGYRPRQILVKSLGEANEVLALLSEGGVFEALAMEFSIDSKTYRDGGDLGYITIGEMPVEFDAALEKMKVGETVGPIKTERGYHIIRLEDSREMERPPLDDKLREQLEFAIMTRRARAAKNKFLAEAKKELGVKYHPEAVRLLDRRFTTLWADQEFLDSTASIGQPGVDASSWFPEFGEDDRNLALVTIGDSTITLGAWISKKLYAPALVWPKGGGDEWIREHLDDTYYRDILIAYGLAKGLREDPEVQEKRGLAREEMLVNTFYRIMVDTVSAPSEEEAWQYYEENLSSYSLPDDLVQGALIHFTDRAAAVETLKGWQAGDDQGALYKTMKERGVLTEWEPSATFLRSEAEAEIFDVCWELEPGDFFGPIEIFGEFIVGRLAGKTPAGPIPWEFAKSRVSSDLLTKRKEQRLKSLLDEFRERYPVHVNDDVLAGSELLNVKKEMEPEA